MESMSSIGGCESMWGLCKDMQDKNIFYEQENLYKHQELAIIHHSFRKRHHKKWFPNSR